MFRWNGGSASFRKRLLRKMPDKNNKVIVSKYFTKNQNSRNFQISHENNINDNLNIHNDIDINHTIIPNQSSEHRIAEKSCSTTISTKDSDENDLKIMIEPSEHESYPFAINSSDILLIDPSYMKIFGFQQDNQAVESTNLNVTSTMTQEMPTNQQNERKIYLSQNKSINKAKKVNYLSDNQFSISNQTVFHKITHLRDIQTQTNM